MFDGSGWSPEKEARYENLGPATGVVPLPHSLVQHFCVTDSRQYESESVVATVAECVFEVVWCVTAPHTKGAVILDEVHNYVVRVKKLWYC